VKTKIYSIKKVANKIDNLLKIVLQTIQISDHFLEDIELLGHLIA